MSRSIFVLIAVATVGLTAPVAHAHQGHSMQEPWVACHDARLGDRCSWTDAHQAVYSGTCRQVTTQLLCVRNHPIVYPPTTPDSRAEHEHEHEREHAHDDSSPHPRDAAVVALPWRGFALGGVGLFGVCLFGLRARGRR